MGNDLPISVFRNFECQMLVVARGGGDNLGTGPCSGEISTLYFFSIPSEILGGRKQ